MIEDNGNSLGLLAMSIAFDVFIEGELGAGNGRPIVACGNELLQADFVKICGKVFEEVAFKWIIAVAINDFVAESVGVKFEISFYFFLDVDVLCVELILFGFFSGGKRPVFCSR